jgi:hypothetical protein
MLECLLTQLQRFELLSLSRQPLITPPCLSLLGSQSAVIGLTKVIGKEYAETNITCNAIAPVLNALRHTSSESHANGSTCCSFRLLFGPLWLLPCLLLRYSPMVILSTPHCPTLSHTSPHLPMLLQTATCSPISHTVPHFFPLSYTIHFPHRLLCCTSHSVLSLAAR